MHKTWVLHACTCLPHICEVKITQPHALQVLINNAGVALPPHKITEDGFEVGNTCCSSLIAQLVAGYRPACCAVLGAHCASRHAESASVRKGWAHPAALLMLGLRNAQTDCCLLLQITLAANYFGPVFLTVISLHPCLNHTF